MSSTVNHTARPSAKSVPPRKRAVPAWSRLPSAAPIGQPTTTHSSPASRGGIDRRGQAPEDADPSAPVGLNGPAAGAVERGPGEARAGEFRLDEPRRDHATVAERSRSKPQSVPARPADEAAGERMVRIVVARVGELLRLGEVRRGRRLEIEDTGPSLGDELAVVEDADDIALRAPTCISTSRGGGVRSVTSTTRAPTSSAIVPARVAAVRRRAPGRGIAAESRSTQSRSSPGWTRTNNPSVNSRMLCQLSYRGLAAAIVARLSAN